MKIIKHAHEETTDAAQGGLLGLVKDSTLEITNCFPFPNQHKPENGDLGKSFSLNYFRFLSGDFGRYRAVSNGYHTKFTSCEFRLFTSGFL